VTDETFVKEFSDLFVSQWTEELAVQGIKHVDRAGSATRMLARTIARTLHEWEKLVLTNSHHPR
jgi:hypothetical protein